MKDFRDIMRARPEFGATEETRAKISTARKLVVMPSGVKVSVINATTWAKRKSVPYSVVNWQL